MPSRELTVPAGDHAVVLAPAHIATKIRRLPEVTDPGLVRDYDGGDDLPDLTGVEFWVAPFLGDGGVRVLEVAAELKVVQLLGAGAERFIDAIGVQAERELVLCNARGAPSGATAEWCVAAMTASLRGFDRSVRAQDEGRWDYRVTGELLGRSILIVGAGDVAQAVVRRLDGWEVDVTLVATTVREGVHGIDELPALLPDADVVLLLVPQTPSTIGLVGSTFLATLKDGALLVNAARGPVIDTDALVAELGRERIFAVVDVTDPEPLPAGHPLWSAPRLMIHPHVAGSVPSTGSRGARMAVEQVGRYLRGEPLRNVVHDY